MPIAPNRLLGDLDLPFAVHACKGLAPAEFAAVGQAGEDVVSIALRMRSSGSPVITWKCHGWVFIDVGERMAMASTSSISVRGTGLSR